MSLHNCVILTGRFQVVTSFRILNDAYEYSLFVLEKSEKKKINITAICRGFGCRNSRKRTVRGCRRTGIIILHP